MKKKAVLFYPTLSSFIKNDLEILSKEYKIFHKGFTPKKKWQTPFKFISQFFFILNHLNASIFITEFANYHSVLPVLLGKLFNIPVLIICGGNDCHSFPSIKYGNYQNKLVSIATKLSLKLSTHISPKHQTLWLSEYTYDKSAPSKQGIKAFIPTIKTPYTVIPNGYDSTFWTPTSKKHREKNSFITVCGNLHLEFQLQLKGIDLLLAMAKMKPNLKFTIVGADENHVIKNLPANVTLHKATDNLNLKELYSAHEYYIQLSMAEGFPNSLCESMLCGCIPIVSNVFSMPEIVNGAGYIVKERDINNFEETMNTIQEKGNVLSGNPRERISHHYNIAVRANSLMQLTKDLAK